MAKTVTLVLVSTEANSNKQYRATLEDDGDTVSCEYGRVGYSPQRVVYSGGEKTFQRKLNEKRRKGYKDVDVVDDESGSAASKSNLRAASIKALARPEFSTDTRLADLIERIVSVNAHDIAMTSGGKIVLADGQLRTPLGVIGRASLDQAEDLLKTLVDPKLAQDRKIAPLEQYLTLVPQNTGRTRGWEDQFLSTANLSKQDEFLDQLRESLEFIETQRAAADGTADEVKAAFKYSLGIIEPDDPRFKSVEKSFMRSINLKHSSSQYRLKALYDVNDVEENVLAYQKLRDELGNEQWLWHGTRASNVLSILSKGFYVPPASASFTTGRLYGDGVYLSNQASKSANYSGGYWAGQKLSSTAFMFSAQVIKGREYKPKSNYGNNWRQVHSDYDSIDVDPSASTVLNHEAVVWNVNQINVRYLLELSM